jgi:hypothetical protein
MLHFIHGKVTAMAITEGFGYSEVLAQWMRQMLIGADKETESNHHCSLTII